MWQAWTDAAQVLTHFMGMGTGTGTGKGSGIGPMAGAISGIGVSAGAMVMGISSISLLCSQRINVRTSVSHRASMIQMPDQERDRLRTTT